MASTPPPPGNNASTPIAIFETSPTGIVLHRIEDYQLDALTNISRPITLGIAGAAIGGFLGLSPAAVTAYDHVGSKTVTSSDLTFLAICAICFIVSIIAWPLAIKGQTDAAAVVRTIRGRSTTRI